MVFECPRVVIRLPTRPTPWQEIALEVAFAPPSVYFPALLIRVAEVFLFREAQGAIIGSTSFSNFTVDPGDRYYSAIVATNSNGSSGCGLSQLGILFGKADAIVKAKRFVGNDIYDT